MPSGETYEIHWDRRRLAWQTALYGLGSACAPILIGFGIAFGAEDLQAMLGLVLGALCTPIMVLGLLSAITRLRSDLPALTFGPDGVVDRSHHGGALRFGWDRVSAVGSGSDFCMRPVLHFVFEEPVELARSLAWWRRLGVSLRVAAGYPHHSIVRHLFDEHTWSRLNVAVHAYTSGASRQHASTEFHVDVTTDAIRVAEPDGSLHEIPIGHLQSVVTEGHREGERMHHFWRLRTAHGEVAVPFHAPGADALRARLRALKGFNDHAYECGLRAKAPRRSTVWRAAGGRRRAKRP